MILCAHDDSFDIYQIIACATPKSYYLTGKRVGTIIYTPTVQKKSVKNGKVK